jgi:hypothetical protein
LEEERRQKMKGIIRNQLLAEMSEVGKGDGQKAGKKEVRAKAKEVARALGEDEDDLVDGVLSGMDVDEDADEDGDDGVVDVPSSSPAPAPSSPMAMDIMNDGSASEKEAPIAIPDDDEEEDDAPVSKKAPTRRLRAGFLDDSDSDE